VASINDVARAAGVSTSTVSYVLSGKRPISAPTRQRVERSIRELGYRPHAGARALASRTTNVLALMAPLRVDVNVSVIMQFVTGVVTSARTFEHDVLLLTQDDAAGNPQVLGQVAVPSVPFRRKKEAIDVINRRSIWIKLVPRIDASQLFIGHAHPSNHGSLHSRGATRERVADAVVVGIR
jgi:transcriptional regulator with XRE-family HTH domain